MNNIKIIRLQNGQDVMADILESDEDEKLILNNPMIIMFKRTQSGSVLMLAPWLPVELINENIATIFNDDILTLFDPKEKLVNYYETMVNVHLVKWMEDDRILDELDVASEEYEEEDNDFESEIDFSTLKSFSIH